MSQLYEFSSTDGQLLQHTSTCLVIFAFAARSSCFVHVVRTEDWAEHKVCFIFLYQVLWNAVETAFDNI